MSSKSFKVGNLVFHHGEKLGQIVRVGQPDVGGFHYCVRWIPEGNTDWVGDKYLEHAPESDATGYVNPRDVPDVKLTPRCEHGTNVAGDKRCAECENDWHKHNAAAGYTESPSPGVCAHGEPLSWNHNCGACAKDVAERVAAFKEYLKLSAKQLPDPVLVNATPTPAPILPTDSAARKNDAGKLDLTLVPIEAMEAIARGMMYGAKKYGRGNYRASGMKWSRLAAACLRHLFAWLFGEDIDAESGNSHLDHALCSLAMLAFQVKNHKEEDDR